MNVSLRGTVLELKNEHFSISIPDTNMDNDSGSR